MPVRKPMFSISSLLLLALTVTVNWFVISVLVGPWWAVLIIFALAGLSLTPIGEGIARFYFGCRRPTREEMFKMEGAWNTVIQACGLDNRVYKPELFVSDQPFPNAFALGTRTVCVTRGLLKTASPDEIAGVFAHEIGHLENGDTKRRLIATVINSAGNVAAMIITAIVIAVGAFQETFGRVSREGWVVFASWFFVAIALLLKVCLGILQLLIQLGFLSVGRAEEFAADDFAKQAGFVNGLVSFLRRMEDVDVRPVGLWAAITRTHPPVAERIDRLLYGPPEKE